MAVRPVLVSVSWIEGLQFAGGPAGRPPVLVDGDSKAAASPVELLLIAAAGCMGADVVPMLEKMRTPVSRLVMEVEGTRREEYPRCFTAIHLRFRLAGAGLDEEKVRRAVDLSLEKYCSVVASLAPHIGVTYDVQLD